MDNLDLLWGKNRRHTLGSVCYLRGSLSHWMDVSKPMKAGGWQKQVEGPLGHFDKCQDF